MIFCKNAIYRVALASILSFLFNFSIKAQYFNHFFQSEKSINSDDSSKLYLKFENINFLKNNEYFNRFYEGYTLIGYMIQPRFRYNISSKAKIEAGIHLLKYSGVNDFTEFLPFFRFHIKASNTMDIVAGTIYGTNNHNLIEPFFDFERYFSNHIENGLQFLINTNFIKSDIWVNWENFIFPNSNIQEQFTVGITNNLIISGKRNSINFLIPIQLIYTHKGGQDLTVKSSIQSLANYSIGIGCDISINKKYLDMLSLRQYIASFSDLSPVKKLPYILGRGFYSTAYFYSGCFSVMVGWWYGENFITPRGEQLFSSVSHSDRFFKRATRALILTKLQFEKMIFKDVTIAARLEHYYDLHIIDFDYSYSFYIKFNKDFFLKKF